MYMDLSGSWDALIPGPSSIAGAYEALLPGTLDENRIGTPEQPDIRTRLTRVCTYEGPVIFSRRLKTALPAGERLFLKVERSRLLTLSIDGIPVKPTDPPTISTPYLFEVTGLIKPGSVISLTCDNSYPGLPHDAIVYASAATDETQTNWNGLLGKICLYSRPQSFIQSLSVLPKACGPEDNLSYSADIMIRLSVEPGYNGNLILTSAYLSDDQIRMTVHADRAADQPAGQTIRLKNLPLNQAAPLWDEYEGNLLTMDFALIRDDGSVTDSRSVHFGLRVLGVRNGRLTLNGRKILIRGETNCAEFPETGYPPVETEAWLDILRTYRSYGVNFIRFHSHCPPEAAFTAADQLGMLLQPELSHWNPKDAFESEESKVYYRNEALAIVRTLANHPSFVMLTFGNELFASDEGHTFMHALLSDLRAIDPTRLYADGSNTHYGQLGPDAGSDFYASQKYFGMDLRGTYADMEGFINHEYPSACHNYTKAMDALRTGYDKPVFSFEVGQYEILPDFEELSIYQGTRRPVNLEQIRKRASARGLMPVWKDYVEATGEIALIGYRAEIEAVLRTPQMSGISLLGLQDFTGQGTALVGMMNAHLKPKPYAFARPERFAAFFREVSLLAELPKYTWTVGEELRVPVLMANYGKQRISGTLEIMLLKEGRTIGCVTEEHVSCACGELERLYTLSLPLEETGRMDLALRLNDIETSYPLWVYPDEPVVWPEDIHVFDRSCEAMRCVLAGGGKVLLLPLADQTVLKHSIRGQFTTDFWSVGTFPSQEGGMGFYIDQHHPALAGFPTYSHTDYQWWPMASGLGVIVPDGTKSIVTMMDSYASLRSLSSLFEARVGRGRLLFCSMGLKEQQQYPEVRALTNSLLHYMEGPDFQPEQEMKIETLEGMFH